MDFQDRLDSVVVPFSREREMDIIADVNEKLMAHPLLSKHFAVMRQFRHAQLRFIVTDRKQNCGVLKTMTFRGMRKICAATIFVNRDGQFSFRRVGVHVAGDLKSPMDGTDLARCLRDWTKHLDGQFPGHNVALQYGFIWQSQMAAAEIHRFSAK